MPNAPQPADNGERPDKQVKPDDTRPPQLALPAIAALSCAASIPMPILAFGVAPALSDATSLHPGIALLVCMLAGLVWQFVLAGVLLWRERRAASGRADWAALLWWRIPIDPATGRRRLALLLVIAPILVATFLIEQTGVADLLAEPLVRLVPWLQTIATPDIAQLADPVFIGAWWLVPLMLAFCLFNYALGEALLFHGYLLPRMHGVFGKWDWLWNGILFGGYHLIRPLSIPSIMVTGAIWAYFSIRYRSSMIAVFAHAVDALFIMALTVGVVSGRLP